MTQTQNVSPGPNPPQFDSLSPNTSAVTLTIGGNDIGFSGIAEDCFTPTPRSDSPCKDQYTAGGRMRSAGASTETAPKVDAVLDGIRARSPKATVFVVNYSAIFPHEGPGCYPQLPVAEGDVQYLRAKQQELNGMLAAQAAANGARSSTSMPRASGMTRAHSRSCAGSSPTRRRQRRRRCIRT